MRPILVRITLILAFVLMWKVAHAAEVGDTDIVLKTLAMEAASEGERGMELVAYTLINRAEARHTTMSTEALRYKQYSCWNDPSWARAWLARYYGVSTHHGAKKALKRAIIAPNRPAISHYHTLDSHPYWARGHKAAIVYGQHAFYEGIA